MKTVLRVLLGAALVYVAACVAVYALGFVAVRSPCCAVPFALYSALTFAPFALLAGVLLERLFPVRPVRWTTLSVLVFALVNVGDIVVQSSQSAIGILRDTSLLFFIFLIGVPATVHAIRRLRSNNRWRGP
jgi:hypothetical protein